METHDKPQKLRTPIAYFAPNRLILLVEYPTMLAPPHRRPELEPALFERDLVRRLRQSLFVEENAILKDARLLSKQITMFPNPPRERRLPGYTLAEQLQEEYRAILDKKVGLLERFEHFLEQRRPAQEDGWSALVPFQLNSPEHYPDLLRECLRLNNSTIDRDPALDNGLIIHGTTVSWYVASTGTEIGGSGPGCPAWPVEDPTQYKLVSDVVTRAAYPQRVEVAILDNMPKRDQLCRAYKRYQASDETLRTLLAGACVETESTTEPLVLRFYDATKLKVQLIKDARIYAHPDVQTDHGLFIASIIHRFAPKATMHLLEVFNDHGVATTDAIIQGLQYLSQIRQDPSIPLLINCSFMLTLPPLDQLLVAALGEAVLQNLPMEDQDSLEQKILESVAPLLLPLYTACLGLTDANTLFVAAAGNFNDDPLSRDEAMVKSILGRLPASFPAAFLAVLGVGALTNDNTSPTDYSNTADLPAIYGVSAFGGEIRTPKNSDQGIVGAYLGDFQVGTPRKRVTNKNGWAMWAGTSFATAVVTGTLAQIAGQQEQGSLLQTVDSFHSLLDNTAIQAIGLRLLGSQTKE